MNIWRHSQAVRQGSAKSSFPGPIPGGASKEAGCMSGFFVLVLNGGDTVIHAVMLCGNFGLLAFDDFAAAFFICLPL